MLLSSRSSQAAKGSMSLTGYSSTESAPRPGQGGSTKGRAWLQWGRHWSLCPSPAQACWLDLSYLSFLLNFPSRPHTPYVHTPSNALHPCPGGSLPWKLRSSDLLDAGDVIQRAGSDLTHTWDLVRQRFLNCLHLMNQVHQGGASNSFLTNSWHDPGVQLGLVVRDH